MITKIRTKGSNCTHILSPPNGLLAWAKAGVTNISLSFVLGAFGRRAARRRCHSRPAKSARTIAVSAPIATLGLPSEFNRFGHCHGEHAALRTRASSEQRLAVGSARHGQIIAGQSRACGGECRARTAQGKRRAAQAHRDPSRGYRKPPRPDGTHARSALPFHRVL